MSPSSPYYSCTVFRHNRSRLVPALAILVFVFLSLHMYTLGLYFNRHLFFPLLARLAAAPS